MRVCARVAAVWLGLGWGLGMGVAGAQQDPTSAPAAGQKSCTIVDEDGKTVVWPGCKPPADDKAPVASPAAATPNANDAPVSKRFPFPGEQPSTDAPPQASGATAAPGTGGGLQDAGSSGSSSSSSSSDSSSSNAGEGGTVGPLADDDDAAKTAAERKAARHKLPPVARQSPDEREAEDLKVAEFYMDDRNFRGAYGRATDAVAIAADDANAHFALAEAARRLGKLDEAVVHYKKSLTLDPIPKVKKAAEKALKEMSGGQTSALLP